ncbi:MAG: hypothetical protein JWP45_59 [Mucilaginibacter sp.]|nr:hypothetical protein [Mucilaginibacter sp.]
MKSLLITLCIALGYNLTVCAQTADNVQENISHLFNVVTPTLTKSVTTISKDVPINDIKGYFKENKNAVAISKDDGVMYKSRLLPGDVQDFLEIKVKEPVTDVDFLKHYDNVKTPEHKFRMLVNYECTDVRHIPRHSSHTADDMQKIVKDKGCSGYTMLIISTP